MAGAPTWGLQEDNPPPPFTWSAAMQKDRSDAPMTVGIFPSSGGPQIFAKILVGNGNLCSVK